MPSPCVTETWLSDFIFDHEILPCGYSLYRKDKSSRGGGVLIAVSDLISSSLIPSPPDLEVITVNVVTMDQSPSAQYMFPLTLRTTIIINCCLTFILLFQLWKMSYLWVTSTCLTYAGHH